jgi:uncharacterized protein (DUF2141 family)
MNKLTLTLGILVSTSVAVLAQNAQIKLKSITRSNDGKVYVQVMDNKKKVVKQAVLDIANKRIDSVFDLPEGQYSVRIFHDENNNRKMDTNFMGLPKEGWAMSNNVKANFGPPSFEKSVFVAKGTVVQDLEMNY